MIIKRITDIYGVIYDVDDSTRNLYKFNNAEKKIYYNVEVVEDGYNTGYWTTYTDEGTVEDLETKLYTWDNVWMQAYMILVRFNPDKYDPQRAQYKLFLKYMESNKRRIFDENGDFRNDIYISYDEIKNWIWGKEGKCTI